LIEQAIKLIKNFHISQKIRKEKNSLKSLAVLGSSGFCTRQELSPAHLGESHCRTAKPHETRHYGKLIENSIAGRIMCPDRWVNTDCQNHRKSGLMIINTGWGKSGELNIPFLFQHVTS